MATLTKEQARILFFNSRGDAILDEQIWFGTATEVDIRISDIVRHAISLGSPALLFAHNHPAGDPNPSKQDIELTRRFINICKALEIKVHDHIIVSRNGSFSFRELGYM
jgi:DNA repair protein RadC